jgi:cytochrome c
MSKSVAAAVAASLLAGAAALAQQPSDNDRQAGELAFNNACRTCHSLKEGDNRLGPSLHGIIGRNAGSLPNYAYSDSMKSVGIVWDEATLDRFIANPDAVVPGNKMKPFGGVASADERAKIIAYLKARG